VVKVCRGRDDLVATYRETIPYQTLSGPTTFIPLINDAVERCKTTKKYHILLIITDGAVQDEEKHYECLTNASHYPLSIVCVGVGDGPWYALSITPCYHNRSPSSLIHI
jgi:E3 ubiquitin-protein ligase RGLG